MTRQDADARVAKGAALLDEQRPGWAHQIDTDHLDIASGRSCVLGQLYGGYGKALLTQDPVPDYLASCDCGFAGSVFSWLDDSRVLQDAWIQAIAERLHPVREPVACVPEPMAVQK